MRKVGPKTRKELSEALIYPSSLAKIFKISKTNINRICRNKSWIKKD